MKIAVKIALLITVETARGMHTALPRVLDALQTDELCPCNWEKGEKTLGKAA